MAAVKFVLDMIVMVFALLSTGVAIHNEEGRDVDMVIDDSGSTRIEMMRRDARSLKAKLMLDDPEKDEQQNGGKQTGALWKAKCSGKGEGGLKEGACNSICAKKVNGFSYAKNWCYTTEDRAKNTKQWCWCEAVRDAAWRKAVAQKVAESKKRSAEKLAAQKRQAKIPSWPSVMTANAARTGHFRFNKGSSSTISKQNGNKVRMDPGWSPRPSGGNSFADLVIPGSACGTGSQLHLVGTAGMMANVPAKKSNGVIFELLQGTKSLISLTLDGAGGSNKTFDVAITGPKLTVRVNDRGNAGWDWFCVDASFKCQASFYVLGDLGEVNCPVGSTAITNSKECQAFAASLSDQGACSGSNGYQSNCEGTSPSAHSKWCSPRPLHCIQDTNKCVVYKGGGVSESYSNARPICKQACPTGYSQLGTIGADVPGWGMSRRDSTASDQSACAASCNAKPNCGSFEWKAPYCALNDWAKSVTSAQTSTWGTSITCKKAKKASACRMNEPVLITSHRGQQLEDRDGTIGLHADRGSWQQWTLSFAGNNQVFITSHRGQQLEDRDGTIGLHADRGSWQQWFITTVGGGNACPQAAEKDEEEEEAEKALNKKKDKDGVPAEKGEKEKEAEKALNKKKDKDSVPAEKDEEEEEEEEEAEKALKKQKDKDKVPAEKDEEEKEAEKALNKKRDKDSLPAEKDEEKEEEEEEAEKALNKKKDKNSVPAEKDEEEEEEEEEAEKALNKQKDKDNVPAEKDEEEKEAEKALNKKKDEASVPAEEDDEEEEEEEEAEKALKKGARGATSSPKKEETKDDGEGGEDDGEGGEEMHDAESTTPPLSDSSGKAVTGTTATKKSESSPTLLYGAVGVLALAALGGGAFALQKKNAQGESGEGAEGAEDAQAEEEEGYYEEYAYEEYGEEEEEGLEEAEEAQEEQEEEEEQQQQ